jgi:hypothetical protein
MKNDSIAFLEIWVYLEVLGKIEMEDDKFVVIFMMV